MNNNKYINEKTAEWWMNECINKWKFEWLIERMSETIYSVWQDIPWINYRMFCQGKQGQINHFKTLLLN